jgi:hypothetical protein
MKTKEEILAEIIDIDRELIDFYWHSSDFITPYQACKAMQQYAEEYHQSEINKLNKSDVIISLRQCTNCVHYRDNFDCDTCNEHLDKWQSNDL